MVKFRIHPIYRMSTIALKTIFDESQQTWQTIRIQDCAYVATITVKMHILSPTYFLDSLRVWPRSLKHVDLDLLRCNQDYRSQGSSKLKQDCFVTVSRDVSCIESWRSGVGVIPNCEWLDLWDLMLPMLLGKYLLEIYWAPQRRHVFDLLAHRICSIRLITYNAAVDTSVFPTYLSRCYGLRF
jgi:hypothetical protein